MKQLASAVALIIALATPLWAGYEKGAAAFMEGRYAVALDELKLPADEGNPEAQFLLGVMYGMGLGVRQDYAESLMWFRNAARQGNANAQACLGVMYYEGRGVKKDYTQAAHWYEKAAEQGNANAQNNLAGLYRTGRGLPRDYVKAHMWYNLSAAQGFDDAGKARDDLAKKMSRKQIARAQELARNWKPVSSSNELQSTKEDPAHSGGSVTIQKSGDSTQN
jgi:TPR repeat protein